MNVNDVGSSFIGIRNQPHIGDRHRPWYDGSEPCDTYEPHHSPKEKRSRKSERHNPPRPQGASMNPEQHPSPEGKRLTRITILHTNDIHGNQKNLPALSAAIAEMLKENPKAILVDCGDIAYNYPYSESHHFEPMPEFLNANAYNISSLGNHEFQWPPATLRQELLERLKPDVLCANILERETGQPIPGLKPYVIREIDGVKVAFIGIVTQDMATPAHPDVGDGLIKLNEDESLKKYAAEARKEGAEVIVALTHQGVGDDKKTADAVPGLDLIIGGHDHFVTDDPLVVGTYPHQTYIVEAGQSAKYLGETTLLFDTESREVLTASMKPIPTGRYFTRPEVAQKAA